MSRRGKGEGTIFEQKKQRKDGTIYSRWCCEVVTGYDKYHDKIVKRVYGKSKPEVIEKKNELLAQQQKGLLPETNSITIAKYADHWFTLKKTILKPKTYQTYKILYDEHIKETLGNIKIQKLSTTQLNDFFAKLCLTKADNTVRHIKAIISNMLNVAISEDIIVVNPVSKCSIAKKKTKREIKVFTEEQIKLILSKAKELQVGTHYNNLYHIVLLALATGFRRGEIGALKWENVDTENNTMTINENLVEVNGGLIFGTPKSRAGFRTIAVNEAVIKELLTIKNDNPLVFHTATGNPIMPSNIGRSFRSLLKRCDLTGFTFHDLRHTHATQLLAKGVNIKQISTRLGHENITITLQIYSHFMPAQDRQAADIMGKMLI